MRGHLLRDTLEPGSRPWLQAMTASKIAAVVGLSKWDTPHSLWQRMAGVIPSEPQTRAQTRGHVYEPMIRDWYAELNGCEVAQTGTWQHHAEAWALASPDGIIETPDDTFRLLEIKTARNYWPDWRDGVPGHYQAQAQWQMWVTGATSTVFAVCGPEHLMDMRPAEYVIDADPAVQSWLAREGELFMDSLTLGVAPAPDYRCDQDRAAIKWQHPNIVDHDPGVVIPDEIAYPYLTALAEQATADGERNYWQARLAEYLGDGKRAVWDGVTLGTRRKGRGGNPPTFSAAPKLADRAHDLLNPNTEENTA